MKRLIRESIYEKFTSDFDDPVVDMGIGGYSFETLRKGAIIKPKETLGISRKDTGKFSSSTAGYVVFPRYYYIVTSVRDYILKGKKEIKFWVPNYSRTNETLEDAQKSKKQYKEASEFPKYTGNEARLIIDKKNFDKRFEIIEQGF